MRKKEYFQGKKVAVIGLARSGFACACLLHELGAEVFVTDQKPNGVIQELAGKLASLGVIVELGRHTKEPIVTSELVVVSPGVPDSALPVSWAQEAGIAVVSEIEVGWALCDCPVIAVTGSAGKTTVSTLIGKVIEASGRKVHTCGNIGTAFCAEINKISPGDLVVLEVSSFQLEKIRSFKPYIAAMLNFKPNHLDRHNNMQEYLDAKKRIFLNQDSNDYLVLNENDDVISNLGERAKSKVVLFKETKDYNPNQAAVVAVAGILGIGEYICRKVFADFKGLEHRMEFVTEIEGVKFINDSKATLVESAAWAIKNITGNIILIAGGRHKGVDYRGILAQAKDKVREVILIGEAADLIAEALKGKIISRKVTSLEEAVKAAFKSAKPGDTILLSPMCSSFDMFSDYEERGRAFKEAIRELGK